MFATKQQAAMRAQASSRAAPSNRAITPHQQQHNARRGPSNSKRTTAVVVVAAVRFAPRGGALASSAALGARRVPIAQPRRSVRARASAVTVQANLFARVSRLIKATLDNLLGSFEDPEKLLDRVVDEMTQDSVRMRQAAAQAIASERQMQARAKTTQAAADQWLRRAELAVAAGQDDLAREALARRKTIQADADRFKQQAVAQKNACEQLQNSVRALESKISEARNKKETLKARAASAKTSMAINDMIGGLKSYGQSSFAAFSKMEEKVMALEAEAQTTEALVAPDALEARFSQLEGGGVEDELRALKAGALSRQGRNSNGNGNGAATLQRPRVDEVLVPSSRDSSIEMELEDLRRRARL